MPPRLDWLMSFRPQVQRLRPMAYCSRSKRLLPATIQPIAIHSSPKIGLTNPHFQLRIRYERGGFYERRAHPYLLGLGGFVQFASNGFGRPGESWGFPANKKN